MDSTQAKSPRQRIALVRASSSTCASNLLQKIFLNALVNQLPAFFAPFSVFLPTSSPLSTASAPTAFVFSAATFVPLTVVSFTSPALSPTSAPTSFVFSPAVFAPLTVLSFTSPALSTTSVPTSFVFSPAVFAPLTVLSFTSPALSTTSVPTSFVFSPAVFAPLTVLSFTSLALSAVFSAALLSFVRFSCPTASPAIAVKRTSPHNPATKSLRILTLPCNELERLSSASNMSQLGCHVKTKRSLNLTDSLSQPSTTECCRCKTCTCIEY